MTFLPRPCFLLVIVFGFVPIRFWESVAKENLAVAVQSESVSYTLSFVLSQFVNFHIHVAG